jgi:hypothetical protein
MKEQPITIPGVPDSLRLCSGCGGIVAGVCQHCGHMDALDHAVRAGRFYAKMRRTDAGIARRYRCSRWLLDLRGWVRLATIVAAECLVLALLIRAALYVFHHF